MLKYILVHRDRHNVQADDENSDRGNKHRHDDGHNVQADNKSSVGSIKNIYSYTLYEQGVGKLLSLIYKYACCQQCI